MIERLTADGEDCINKECLVFDNEEFYCCFGPTTQLNAVTKARELNEKHAGKDEVSALKTRIAELEKIAYAVQSAVDKVYGSYSTYEIYVDTVDKARELLKEKE